MRLRLFCLLFGLLRGVAAVAPGMQGPLVDPAWVPTWQFSYHPVTPHVRSYSISNKMAHMPLTNMSVSLLSLLKTYAQRPLQVSHQGDISGGLLLNNTWHFFTSCTGGWCHLSSPDLVRWQSHGVVTAHSSHSYNKSLGLGTGSVLPSPNGDGILGWVNNQNAHMISRDGMRTWTALSTKTIGSPGYDANSLSV